MKAKKFFLALLGTVTALSLSAQTVVKGVVTDENGEPLIGAGVLVQGTSVGTITGLDGDYQLTVPANAENLVFSFIGLADQVVALDGQTEINVVLHSDQTFLDEVVVVGYATVKRRDLLGSVSSVGSDKLAEQPVTTVSQALSGKMAGVSVVTTEGDPDADIKIRVRGGGSITQDSSPLYIHLRFPGCQRCRDRDHQERRERPEGLRQVQRLLWFEDDGQQGRHRGHGFRQLRQVPV